MKKIIGIDIDEVLSETLDEVLKYNNYKFKWLPIKRKDVTDYYVYKIPEYNWSVDDAIVFFGKAIRSKSVQSNIKPVIWARNKLRQLKKEWWQIILITARAIDVKDFTEKWLNKYFLWLWDDIVFTNHFTKDSVNKSEVCEKLWIKIMIEDNLDYSRELANKWIKVWLIDRPWNISYDKKIDKNIVKFKKWNEVKI